MRFPRVWIRVISNSCRISCYLASRLLRLNVRRRGARVQLMLLYNIAIITARSRRSRYKRCIRCDNLTLSFRRYSAWHRFHLFQIADQPAWLSCAIFTRERRKLLAQHIRHITLHCSIFLSIITMIDEGTLIRFAENSIVMSANYLRMFLSHWFSF